MQCAHCEKQEGFGRKVLVELELNGARIFVHGNYVSEPPSVDIALGKTGTIRAFFEDPKTPKKAYKAFSYACKQCRLEEAVGHQTIVVLGLRMTKHLAAWPSDEESSIEDFSDEAPTQPVQEPKGPKGPKDPQAKSDTEEDVGSETGEAPEARESREAREAPETQAKPKKRKLEKESKRPKKAPKTDKEDLENLHTKLDLVVDTLSALLTVLKKN